MPLLKAEAEKLSNNTLLSGVIDEIIERDDLFAVLPFMQVNSKAYVYNRESEGAQNNITAGDGLPTFITPATDTIVEGAVPFVEVIAKLAVLAGDVDVDNFAQETMGDTNNQTAIQIAKKAKAVGRKYHQTLATGDVTGDPKSFDGVKEMVSAGQTLDAGSGAGASLTLSMLDQLLDQVPLGADVLMMRKGTLRAFRTLLRVAGGTTAAEFMMPAFGRPMLTHNGVPIIINDFLPGNETFGSSSGICASVYALRLNEADGLHGLYGGPSAGLRVETVGTVQNKDAKRYRVKWYASACLKSTKSIARLQGVLNV